MPERWVTARDGVRLWATEHGNGHTVVIPGAALLEDDLDPLFQEFHVILYDIRNRGRSDPVPLTGEVGVPVELDDIEAVCNEFGVVSFSLIGWSYGTTDSAAAVYDELSLRLSEIGAVPAAGTRTLLKRSH